MDEADKRTECSEIIVTKTDEEKSPSYKKSGVVRERAYCVTHTHFNKLN
jgi:hypothetical protein